MTCDCCRGACCTEGVCEATLASECSGCWLGPGTNCDNDPCPSPCGPCESREGCGECVSTCGQCETCVDGVCTSTCSESECCVGGECVTCGPCEECQTVGGYSICAPLCDSCSECVEGVCVSACAESDCCVNGECEPCGGCDACGVIDQLGNYGCVPGAACPPGESCCCREGAGTGFCVGPCPTNWVIEATFCGHTLTMTADDSNCKVEFTDGYICACDDSDNCCVSNRGITTRTCIDGECPCIGFFRILAVGPAGEDSEWGFCARTYQADIVDGVLTNIVEGSNTPPDPCDCSPAELTVTLSYNPLP